MRFTIDEIRQEGNKTIVKGKTSIGEIKGVWKYAEPPVIKNDYTVEFNIDSPDEVEMPSKMNTFPFVYLDNEVYYLRFDVDWIEMLDIDVITVKKRKEDSISFAADYYSVGIYPYAL